MVTGVDIPGFSELQIVTPKSWEKENLRIGSVVQVLCYQWEFLEEADFRSSHTSPIVRFAHLSRTGFTRMPDGTLHVRPHVIDMHSSKGNSGAIAIAYVSQQVGANSAIMFLGIVQGFIEERGGYEEYRAPIREASTIPLQLVNNATGATNNVAITIKTIANPNLTLITPVHELTTLRNSSEFIGACLWMASHKSEYEMLSDLATTGSSTLAQTPASGWFALLKVISLFVLVPLAILSILVLSWKCLRKSPPSEVVNDNSGF
jgi:hypothetical protein